LKGWGVISIEAATVWMLGAFGRSGRKYQSDRLLGLLPLKTDSGHRGFSEAVAQNAEREPKLPYALALSTIRLISYALP
jgi:hypothetical protein